MDNIDSLNDYNDTEKTWMRFSLYSSDDDVTDNDSDRDDADGHAL
jgi:hypothetical protein